jgi:hypothetical protein
MRTGFVRIKIWDIDINGGLYIPSMATYFDQEAHVKTGHLKVGDRMYKIFYHGQTVGCNSVIFRTMDDGVTLIGADTNDIQERFGFREAVHM